MYLSEQSVQCGSSMKGLEGGWEPLCHRGSGIVGPDSFLGDLFFIQKKYLLFQTIFRSCLNTERLLKARNSSAIPLARLLKTKPVWRAKKP